jgi:hypothetical protein
MPKASRRQLARTSCVGERQVERCTGFPRLSRAPGTIVDTISAAELPFLLAV